jgi:hypothetical protein
LWFSTGNQASGKPRISVVYSPWSPPKRLKSNRERQFPLPATWFRQLLPNRHLKNPAMCGLVGPMRIIAAYNTYAARIPDMPWINLQFILAKKE